MNWGKKRFKVETQRNKSKNTSKGDAKNMTVILPLNIFLCKSGMRFSCYQCPILVENTYGRCIG